MAKGASNVSIRIIPPTTARSRTYQAFKKNCLPNAIRCRTWLLHEENVEAEDADALCELDGCPVLR